MTSIFSGNPARWPVTVYEPVDRPAGWEHRLVLRPLRRRDQEEWFSLRHRNAGWLLPWENTDPVEAENVTHYNFATMVRSMQRTAKSGHSLPWVIAKELDDGGPTVLIGQLAVSGIFYGSLRSAAIGYWIDESHAGFGLTPRAVALAVDHCFTRLGLHRLEINIVPQNANSLRVVDKLGFRFEGTRKNYLHINGAWVDHQSFALTAEEVPAGGLWQQIARNNS
ncbi:GNAT family N-acetyltransferase [Micrococcoides hystricis]|uniref:GNAT family N-acetyltransferase n=1 Tax=Micrococcoides hystricis TaxID=1572761 RepID=A0ABV6P9Z4_9MICC